MQIVFYHYFFNPILNNLFWNRFFDSSVLILPVKELNEVLSSKLQTEKLIFTWNKNMKIKQNTDCPNYWKSRLHTYPTKNLWLFFNSLPRWKRKPHIKFKFAFNDNFVINTALDIYTVEYCASLFKMILKTHSLTYLSYTWLYFWEQANSSRSYKNELYRLFPLLLKIIAQKYFYWRNCFYLRLPTLLSYS